MRTAEETLGRYKEGKSFLPRGLCAFAERFSGWRTFLTGLAHLLAASGFNAFAFKVNIFVESVFHFLTSFLGW
jgi:hypothetical protein